MQKLGRKQLTLHLQEPLARSCRPALARLAAGAARRGAASCEYQLRRRPARRSAACPALLRRLGELGIAFEDLNTSQSSLEEIFVSLVSAPRRRRSARAVSGVGVQPPRRLGDLPLRDGALRCAPLLQSVVTPVITTSLYFVVFGSAIGSRMSAGHGVPYGAFIVPGLIMLSLFTESLSNASFGIYMPKFTGTIYELLSAPVSPLEIVLGYVGAAATKSIALGLIILATATLFVPLHILHPVWMVAFLLLTAATFSLFGFIIGIWANELRAAAGHPDAGR